MREKGQPITVNCKRCGVKMLKWQRPREDGKAHPYPFDSICGRCITPKEIASSSLQNHSDPDAGYDAHKGQGYQVQVMELIVSLPTSRSRKRR